MRGIPAGLDMVEKRRTIVLYYVGISNTSDWKSQYSTQNTDMTANRRPSDSSTRSSVEPIIFTPASTVFEFRMRSDSSSIDEKPTSRKASSCSPILGSASASSSQFSCICPNISPTKTRRGSATSEKKAPSIFSSSNRVEDRDKPLASIEGESSTADHRLGTPGGTTTPPTLFPWPLFPGKEPKTTNTPLDSPQQIYNARCETAERRSTISSEREASTPSINITPATSRDEFISRESSRSQSFVARLSGLQMNSSSPTPAPSALHTSQSPTASPESSRSQSLTARLSALHMGSPSPSSNSSTPHAGRSPSASSRRRSGSRTAKVIHRVEDEEPPESLFYKKEVQNTLSGAKAIVSRLSDVLSSSALYQDTESSIGSLRRRVAELNAFALHTSRTVGLVGDSGAGKSSLINSLLDYKDLARASNSGQACTCVVTEYKYHNRDDFAIGIEYFTVEELKTIYEDLLAAYRDHTKSPADGRPTENSKESKKKADLALSTFKSSFRGRLEDTPTILSSMSFDAAIQKMVGWARSILPVRPLFGSAAGFQEHHGSVKECSARLSQLTSEVNSPDADQTRPPWPFVKRLTVHLKSVILSKGLIIADLPGLRDSNSARQSITERYMRDCHQIFAVAKIDRVITDQSVKDIFELARRAKLSDVSIICTRSDEVNASQAINDFPQEKAWIKSVLSKIKADEENISALEEELEEFKTYEELLPEEIQEENSKRRECDDAKKSKRDHQFQLDQNLVRVRNNHVSRAIRKQYRNPSGDQELQIFCVSNTIYWKHRELPVAQAEPRLQLSGVLALRRYCIGIVAESHYQATKEFVNDAIPAFIASLRIWLDASAGSPSAERKEEILEMLTSIEDKLSQITAPTPQLIFMSERLSRTFRERIYSQMSKPHRVSNWSRCSTAASLEWNSYHHSTYRAFCTNYGTHSTDAKSACWNEEAMAEMTNDMQPEWDALTTDHVNALQEFQDSISSSYEEAMREALNKSQSSKFRETRSTFLPLIDLLRSCHSLSIRSVRNATFDFTNHQLRKLRVNALSPVRTAIIGKLMESSYHAANMEYDKGSDRRRKHHITSGFGDSNLFLEHFRLALDEHEGLVDAFERKIGDIVKEQVRVVVENLNIIRDGNVVEESERDPEFRERLAAEVHKVSGELESLRLGIDGLRDGAMDVDGED